MSRGSLPTSAYARLLSLRTGLRHFERWSEQQARAAGLTPAQHQLLLAIRGHDDPRGPTVGEVADYLLLRHHSVVGLVDRADAAGLVSRERDAEDRRVVRLRLTDDGSKRLEELSALHLEELRRLAAQISGTWEGLDPVQRAHGFPEAPRRSPGSEVAKGGGERGSARHWEAAISVARVYDHLAEGMGTRVLVDRLWPRGIARDTAPWDLWAKEVAPSDELRRWYGHDPVRFEEFAEKYRTELAEPSHSDALDKLRSAARRGGLVLVTATRDVDRSAAAVLKALLVTR